ncbi:glycosyltransferase [Methylobacterium sp. OT2]|uniref:glycosyltransferase n=1 Tax=Methylobacterium sp. OT2 TaxID=2813779 RepID=UPI00197C224B|nr:glycosyltransferase [Methylobacterium sp. OT2]MBN4094692.1 glycosyltransferase [Methylobacterium sp. OT2]
MTEQKHNRSQQLSTEGLDPEWYAAHYTDVADAGMDPLEHYLRFGRAEGRAPSQRAWELNKLAHEAFDPKWYVAHYSDVADTGMDPLEHYLRFGRAEGRAPSQRAWELGELAHEAFDPKWYAAHYSDVADTGMDPLEHYLRFGRTEGRAPSQRAWELSELAHETFDPKWYAAHYSDVADARIDPLEHYLRFGRVEGRAPSQRAWELGELAHEAFDPKWYAAHYSDVADAGMDPLEHYLRFGRAEGRAPSQRVWELGELAHEAFDAEWYAEWNPDISGTDLTSTQHYLRHGRYEGRAPTLQLERAKVYNRKRSGANQSSARKLIPKNMLIRFPITKKYLSTLEFCTRTDPQVSVIILSYQRPDLVENLIKSIWLYTSNVKYEIIVVDNGSPLGTHELDTAFANYIKYIKLEHNIYIGDAYNIGVESSSSEYCVLMNNDIVVQPNWLSTMFELMIADETVGVVGPKFLYPDDTLQEAGALIDSSGYSIQLGKRNDETLPEFNIRREVDYVTGATALFRKDLYIKNFGYSWKWAPGYYEDADLCFSIRAQGFKVIYEPASVVYHLESITMSEMPPSENLSAAVAANRLKFVKKWSGVLNKEVNLRSSACHKRVYGLSSTGNPYKSRETKGGVGVYLPYGISPGGGENYILSIAQCLTTLNRVALVFNSRQSSLRVLSVLTDLNIDLENFDIVLLQDAEKADFDIFIALGNELFPSLKGLGKKSYYICQFPFDTRFEELNSRFEKGLHLTYDGYIAYSNYSRKYILENSAMWSFSPRVTVINPAVHSIGPIEGYAPNNNIIGVGRFFVGGHNKRHDKLIEAFRTLEKLNTANKIHEDITLNLAGAVHPDLRHREHLSRLMSIAEDANINFYVDVGRRELEELYQNAKVYWHAAGYGVDPAYRPEVAEHFGITIVEAMSAGCVPVVIGVGGPTEIVRHGLNGYVISSAHEMAEVTFRILRDWNSNEMKLIRQAAIETARGFSFERFCKEIKTLLEKD